MFVVAAGFFSSFLLLLALGLVGLLVTAVLDKAVGKERALFLWAFVLVGGCFLLRPAAPPPSNPQPKPLDLPAALDPSKLGKVDVQVFQREPLPRSDRNPFEEQSDTHALPPERLAEPPDVALAFPLPPTVPGAAPSARWLYRGAVPTIQAGDGSKLPDVPDDGFTAWQPEAADVFDWVMQGGKRYFIYIRAIDDVKEGDPAFDRLKWALVTKEGLPADKSWGSLQVSLAAIGPDEDAKKLVATPRKARNLRVSTVAASEHEQGWFLRRSVDNLYVEACRRAGSPRPADLSVDSLKSVAAEMATVGTKGNEDGRGWTRAIEALELALAKCKQPPARDPADVLLLLIEAYRAVHDETRLLAALADYLQTGQGATSRADGATWAGDVFLERLRLPDVADLFYGRALKAQAGWRGALVGRGDALSAMGDHAGALKVYRTAGDAGARGELSVREGEALLRTGDVAGARQAADAALGANSFDARAFLVKGAALYAAGDLAAAREAFAQAAVLPGDGPAGMLARRHRAEALMDLGLTEWRLGHGDAAVAAFDAADRALRAGAQRGRSADETVVPELGRALVLLSQGNVDAASESLDRARLLAPGVAYVEMLAGWIARMQADPARARGRFEAALALAPGLSELDGWLSETRLGVALEAVNAGKPASDVAGDFDAAARFAQRAAEREARRDPKNQDFAVRTALVQLRALHLPERRRFADALATAEAVLARAREERRALAIKGYCNYRLGATDAPRYDQCLRDFQAVVDLQAPEADPWRAYAAACLKTVKRWLALEERLLEFGETKLSSEWATIENHGIRTGPDDGWLVFRDVSRGAGATDDGSVTDVTVAARARKLFTKRTLEKVQVWVSVPKTDRDGAAANNIVFGVVAQPLSDGKGLAKNQGFGLFYDKGKVAVRIGGGTDPAFKDGEMHRVTRDGAEVDWPDPTAEGGGVMVEIERTGDDGTEIVLRLGNQQVLKDRVPAFKRTAGDFELWLGGWSNKASNWDVRVDNVRVVRSK